MASLSVIIPTHNRAAVLKQALRCLAEGSEKPGEVIVIDDASEYPVNKHLEGEFPGLPLTLIRFEKNRGAAAARNAGIRAAKGDILVCQDDDIFADHHMIHCHKKIHEQHPEKTYGVMGRIYFDPDLCRNPVMHYLEEYGVFKGITKSPDRSPVTTGLISANFSLKRDLLKDEKLFDENFPFNRNEDTEFGLRMMEKGLNLRFHIAPSARHHSQLTIAVFFKQLEQGGFSKAYWSGIRPDDSEYCLRLGLAVIRKIHQVEFDEYFQKYIDTFGEEFLSRDISQCPESEFEEFRFFMDTSISWRHFIGLVDGWLEIVPGFPGILKKISAAFETPNPKKKFKYWDEAYRLNRNFFPLALQWGDILCGKNEYPEAHRVLIPFENLVWGKLKLAKINYHLENFETCYKLLHDVFAQTRHEKSVETKQRMQADEILSLVIKKEKNKKWLDLIRSHLAVDDSAPWAAREGIPGTGDKIPPGGTKGENSLVNYYRKKKDIRILKEKLNDLTKRVSVSIDKNRYA